MNQTGIEPGDVLERFEAIDVDQELMRNGDCRSAVAFNDGTADGNPVCTGDKRFRLGR